MKLDYTGSNDDYAGLDRFNRVVDQVWQKYGQNAATLDHFDYGYDRFGNVAWKENVVAHDDGVVELTEVYYYNSVNNLISAILLDNDYGGQTWTPDALGNINGTTNAANEITATGYVYDHNGNLTADGTCVYTYDAWNRLVSVTEGATTVGYRYDGQGRRTERIVGGAVERYYYAGQQVVQVDTFSGGVLQGSEQYVWSAMYVDSPVLRDSFDANGDRIAADRIYYLTDANHNVTSLVDASGAVVERYYSSSYGQVTIITPDWTQTLRDSAYGNTILFAGMDYDPSTELYYDRARWYNPATGTFLTRDPAAADVNLYRYCHNDPISSTDPTGLDEYYVFPLFSDIDTESLPIALHYYPVYSPSTPGPVAEHSATGRGAAWSKPAQDSCRGDTIGAVTPYTPIPQPVGGNGAAFFGSPGPHSSGEVKGGVASGEASAVHGGDSTQKKYVGGKCKIDAGKVEGEIGIRGIKGGGSLAEASGEGHIGSKENNAGLGLGMKGFTAEGGLGYDAKKKAIGIGGSAAFVEMDHIIYITFCGYRIGFNLKLRIGVAGKVSVGGATGADVGPIGGYIIFGH